MEMKKCTYCGRENIFDMPYCGYCRSAFSAENTITTFYALNASELSALAPSEPLASPISAPDVNRRVYREQPSESGPFPIYVTNSVPTSSPIEDFVIEDNILKMYNGSEEHVVIPYGVKKIGNFAFLGHYSLKSITIPNSVTSIGDSAFEACTELTSITIPASVISIGDSAFKACTELTSITIPASVTSIGDNAFSFCFPRNGITIPISVTNISDSAFENCYASIIWSL